MRVLVAMSGGLDSTVAASLLLAEGAVAEGCTLSLLPDGDGEELLRAEAAAASLSMPHTVLDLREAFRERVILPFARAYAEGKTPNPCLLCNRHIKFGALFSHAMERGFSHLATGHYARIECVAGRYRLKKGADAAKDQSYVLYRLEEQMLPHLLFPLGDYEKGEVRRLAEERGLHAAASAKESQDICFVKRGSYTSLIEELTGGGEVRGHFVDAEGKVLGPHRGIAHYTVGQHKGLSVSLGRVRYVTAIDPASGNVTLGDEADCYRSEVFVPDMHYIAPERPSAPFRASVKLRYRQTEEEATVYPEGEGARLLFDRPQRAPAPGQSAVLYDGDYVVGGGEIALSR